MTHHPGYRYRPDGAMPCREIISGPDVLVPPYSPCSKEHKWGSHTEEYFLMRVEVRISVFAV
jgi:hypothetical protein